MCARDVCKFAKYKEELRDAVQHLGEGDMKMWAKVYRVTLPYAVRKVRNIVGNEATRIRARAESAVRI